MFVKLAVIACSLAVAAAGYNGPLAGGQPAAQYPAGVDPAACPDYPICSNPAVAVDQSPQQYHAAPQYSPYQAAPQYPQYQAAPQYSQYQAAPQYQPQQYQAPQPQYNPAQYAQQAPRGQYSPDVQNALDKGEYIGDGDYHGEGLAEALAPGYAGHHQQAYNAAPAYNPAAYNQAAYNPAAQYSAPAPQYAHAQPAQIPAGVDARSCPNYPFCH